MAGASMWSCKDAKAAPVKKDLVLYGVGNIDLIGDIVLFFKACEKRAQPVRCGRLLTARTEQDPVQQKCQARDRPLRVGRECQS